MMPSRVAPAGSTTAFACEDTIHLRHTGATPVDCSLSCRHYRLNASLPQHSECDRGFAKARDGLPPHAPRPQVLDEGRARLE